MAKAQPQPSRADQARNAARKSAAFTWSMVWWIIPIAVVVVGIYYLFLRDRDPLMGSTSSVESLVEGYTEFVRPYAPPSSLSPSQDTVDSWLEYFDPASRSWFRSNVEKLSFVQYQTRVDEWKGFNEGRRKMEAMRYVLSVGPLRGGSIVSVRHNDDDSGAVADLFTGSSSSLVQVQKFDGRWLFPDMMGQRADIERRLQATTLPK